MPYTRLDQLPPPVRKLSEAKQRQWLEVFNSVYRRLQQEGNSAEECERAAFRQANGVVKMEAAQVDFPPVLKSPLRLDGGAPLELEAAASPDRQPFLGTMTFAGRISDGAVGGTEVIEGGPYRVLIPREVMAEKILELVDKDVYAAQDLAGHSHAVPIGTFTDAWLEEATGEVHVGGFFTKSKHKTLVSTVVAEARAGRLGFSYDIKNVAYRLNDSVAPGETVLEVTAFEWRGATVLRRAAAAYRLTQLAAKHQPSQPDDKEQDMTPEEIRAAISEVVTPLLAPLAQVHTSVTSVENKVNGLEAKVTALEAANKNTNPPPAEPKAAAPPTEMPLQDFAKTVSDAIVAGLKPVLEAATKPKTNEGGTRRTFSAADIAVVKRWNADQKDDGEVTVESIQRSIDAVHASNLSKEQKLNTLAGLSAMKTQALRRSGKEAQ